MIDSRCPRRGRGLALVGGGVALRRHVQIVEPLDPYLAQEAARVAVTPRELAGVVQT